MNHDQTRLYLLSKPESYEDFPFFPDLAVMKIGKRMFATLGERGGVASMNLKCDPHEALILRDIFPAVTPGYHMNKRHWNTVSLDGSVPTALIRELIDHSYDLVVASLPKAKRP